MSDDIDVYDRIIWSADVPDIGTMLEYLDQMPLLKWVKVDRSFVDANGWEIFDLLNERGLKSFDDGKCIEIPSKLRMLAGIHCSHQPTMSNCMAGNVSTGNMSGDAETLDGLKQWADVCLSSGVLPCGVTVLTSKTPETVAQEFGYPPPGSEGAVISKVLWYVERLVEAGFTDAVCSPKEAAEVTKYFGEAINLNTPGVRPKGTAVGDQARVDTPGFAYAAGATRLVIGRPLTNGELGTPAESLQAIVDELNEFII